MDTKSRYKTPKNLWLKAARSPPTNAFPAVIVPLYGVMKPGSQKKVPNPAARKPPSILGACRFMGRRFSRVPACLSGAVYIIYYNAINSTVRGAYLKDVGQDGLAPVAHSPLLQLFKNKLNHVLGQQPQGIELAAIGFIRITIATAGHKEHR